MLYKVDHTKRYNILNNIYIEQCQGYTQLYQRKNVLTISDVKEIFSKFLSITSENMCQLNIFKDA